MLLDTHIWIWWLDGSDELTQKEREALDSFAAVQPPSISAFSLWEVQMLHAKGRVSFDRPFDTWLVGVTAPDVVTLLPIDTAVILELNDLPKSFHGDPADRLIVATARAYDLELATRDTRIRRSRLTRLWRA